MARYYLYLIFATFIWGGSFVGTKIALSEIRPMTLIFMRYVIGGVIVLVASRYIKMQNIEKNDLKWLILLCVFEPGLYFIFETYGIRETDPVVASLIIALIPVFVLLIAAVAGIERVTVNKVVGIFLSVGGVSIISFGNTDSVTSTQSSIRGIILVLMATITASSFTVLLSKLAKKYGSFTLASIQIIFTVIFYLPLAIIENFPDYRFDWSPRSIYALLYLGVFPTFFAYLFYAKGLSRIEGSTASLFTNLIPIFTAIISAVILSTYPSINTLIGGILIIGGVTLVTYNRRVDMDIPLTT